MAFYVWERRVCERSYSFLSYFMNLAFIRKLKLNYIPENIGTFILRLTIKALQKPSHHLGSF